MKKVWQIQEAKNRFSDLVNEALRRGPQTITRRGVSTVVVMSVKDFKRLVSHKASLVEFFQKSPLCGIDLDLERSTEPCREVDL